MIKCGRCGKKINAGYVVSNVKERYCSRECFDEHYIKRRRREKLGCAIWAKWDDSGVIIK